jgi:plasmid stability protein
MKNLIIRDLDDSLLFQLKKRAWQQGLSLEESLRRLVVASVANECEPPDADISSPPRYVSVQIAKRFAVTLHS